MILHTDKCLLIPQLLPRVLGYSISEEYTPLLRPSVHILRSLSTIILGLLPPQLNVGKLFQ